MKATALALGLAASAVAIPTWAAEGPTPHGIPRIDHVFVIMMENHGYSQIVDNPNAPFINKYATIGEPRRPTTSRSRTRA